MTSIDELQTKVDTLQGVVDATSDYIDVLVESSEIVAKLIESGRPHKAAEGVKHITISLKMMRYDLMPVLNKAESKKG